MSPALPEGRGAGVGAGRGARAGAPRGSAGPAVPSTPLARATALHFLGPGAPPNALFCLRKALRAGARRAGEPGEPGGRSGLSGVVCTRFAAPLLLLNSSLSLSLLIGHSLFPVLLFVLLSF